MNDAAPFEPSINSEESVPPTHEEILYSVRQLLKNQVFSGRFEERRLIEVNSVSMYKDIVVLDESELEFLKILKAANDILKNHFQNDVITCISENWTNLKSSNSYSIWTNLDGVPLGSHWFQVKDISLFTDIIYISLKSLRPLKTDSETFSDVNVSDFFSPIGLNFLKKWLLGSIECLKMENIVTLSRFVAVMFLTFAVGCYHLLELLLRGVKEVNVFVYNITPVLIACVDGITKIFGGFFILIAMMWNSWHNQNKPSYSSFPSIHSSAQREHSMLMDYAMGNTNKHRSSHLLYKRKAK